ncbi:MAG: hypothetical protein ACR2KG_07755 [Nocardioidaceae bacterium]
MEAAHTGRFARWYIDNLFPRLPSGTPVCVHGVYHGKQALPFTEGAVVLKWLTATATEFFTPAPARATDAYRTLLDVKHRLGLDEPVRTSRDNR